MTETFLSLVKGCVSAAQRGMFFEDFKLHARHSKPMGQTHDDQVRVLKTLISEGFIELEDSRLKLGKLVPTDWLKAATVDSGKEVWEIIDLFPRNKWKFDPDAFANAALGAEGEAFVISKLVEELGLVEAKRIQHVSLTDDSAGYDILAPSLFGSHPQCQLEIKTTSRQDGWGHFFLSLNEFDASQAMPNWHMVLVLKASTGFEILGHLPGSHLKGLMPLNVSQDVKWQTVFGSFHPRDLSPFLP